MAEITILTCTACEWQWVKEWTGDRCPKCGCQTIKPSEDRNLHEPDHRPDEHA